MPKEHLAAREPERLLRIHAELPLDRITPVLAGWLRKLEPLGHGNPEPSSSPAACAWSPRRAS
jgi:single-stranded-DNA-specific exonuclease